MRTLHFGISWKRFVALVLLPFFAINTLSVSLVTAASGDEYLTGSTEPIVEMIAPNIWLDAALAERTGSTEQITTESGSTAIGEDSTGATLSGEISTGATLEPEIVSDTGSMIADDTSLSGATLSGETLTGTLFVDTGATVTGTTITGDTLTLSGDLILSSSTVTITIASGSEIQALDSDKNITEVPTLSEIAIDETVSASEKSQILNDPQVTGESNSKKNDIVESAFQFGSSGSHLIFSIPARVEMEVSGYSEGESVQIYVQHLGDSDFSTDSLSTDPASSCTDTGRSTIISNTATVTDGRVVFYTCGASTFIINALGASALKLWLKANAGTSCSTSGCALSSWADQSGLANNGSGRATSPTYISQRWNFNPAIRFISGDFITANNGGIQGNMSMIAVYSTTQSAGDATFWNSPALIGGESNSGTNDYALGLSAGLLHIKALAGDTLGTRDTVVSNTGKPFITVGTRAISGNSIIYKNGRQMATAASDATLLNTTTKFGIGQHEVSTSGGQFVGDIMEAMVYTGVLTAANRNKIDSYLALKYGITLDQTTATNYVLSGGQIAWNSATTPTAYKLDIAGIGRDDGTTLNQIKSQSSNSTGDIIVENIAGSFASNNLTLTWANDAGAANAWVATDRPTDLVDGTFSRITREWKFQEINSDTGMMKIYYPTAAVPAGYTGTIRLLTDANGTFATLSTQYVGVLSGSNWEFTLNPADATYITFAYTTNIAPVANNDNMTVVEDSSSGVLNIIANDTDSNGGDIISLSGIVTTPTKGTLTNSGTTSVVYTPTANTCGTDTFTYRAKDQLNSLSNIATGTITVTCVNDAPTSSNVTQTSNEDVQFIFTGGSFPFIDVDSGTVIASGSILSGVTIVSLASTGTLKLSGVAVSTGQVIASGSLVNLTYDPVLNGNGTPYATFTFRVTDNGGLTSVATYTYQFNITPVNDAPTAVNDVRSTSEDTPVNWNLRSNDFDIDGTGETLTDNTWTQPTNGIVTQSGIFLNYAPTLNYCGADTFNYTIKDQNNAVSNTGTVSITVTCVNDAPVVVNDTGSIAQSGSGFIAVLANDTDPDIGDTKTISGYTLPSNGSIIKTATGFTYTANSTFCGVDIFAYRITDTAGIFSNTGTVSVTIISCDTTPPVTTLTGPATLTIAQGSVYTDSGAAWTDNVDGSGNTISGIYGATGSFQSSGSVNTSLVGVYTIQYRKVDAAGNISNTVNRTITVTDQSLPTVILTGASITVSYGLGYTTGSGVSWTDNVDGSGNTISGTYGATGSFQMSGTTITTTTIPGLYTQQYQKVDAAGNASTITNRTITVQDTTPPVTTLTGPATLTIAQGSVYTDSGAAWTDNVDGSGVINPASSGSVDTNTVGIYTLSYTHTDTAGNSGNTVTRTVTVIDQTAPTVPTTTASPNPSSGGLVTITTGLVESGATVSIPGTNCTPSPSTGGVVTCSGTGTTIGSNPTITVTDLAGNASTGSVALIVDTTAPDTILVSTGTTISSGSTIIGSTANIAFESTEFGSIFQCSIDGGVYTLCTSVKSYTSLVNGSHTIQIRSVDTAGNQDPTPIIITFIVNVPISIAPPSGGSSSSPLLLTPIVLSPKKEAPLVVFSDKLLPTQVFLTPAEKTPEGQPIYSLNSRTTDYICPKLVQVYDEKDLITLDIPTTEFTDDIKALIMFRGLELNEPKGVQTFEEYKKYGIALNATKFEPYRNVTRAEFVKMLVRSLSCRYEYVGVDSNFPDVSQDTWYAEYITFAVKNRWINGYTDGDFRPDAPITRAEAAKILANAIKLTSSTKFSSSFKDVPKDSTFVPYIELLKNKKIISGKTKTTYEPNAKISRTEVSRLIYKTFLGGQP